MARFHTTRLGHMYYERLGYLENGDELYGVFDPAGIFLAVNSVSINDVRHFGGSYDEFWNQNYNVTSDIPFDLRHTGVPGTALYRGLPFHELNFHPMEEPVPPEPQPQQRELVAYVKFFTNARGQLAVAAALTPDALHRANMVEPANELKRLKIKTTV